MINRLLTWFKSPKVLTIVGILALMLAIFLVLPLLKITGDQRTNVTLLIGGLALFASIIIWIKNWWQERKFSSELKGQARDQASKAEASEAAEIVQLQREFDRAMEELARIKPGSNIFKAGSSESLPWVAIIGPPGAGKSTVLQASGLRFTSLGKRVRGIGGTRNCVFWLAEEAIFIDTAGRYSNQEEDHDEWLGFLKLLRKFRKQRPLDAAILQVGIDEIINLPHSEVEEVATTLRTRLDELIAQLQVRFPVYLVFNKLDRLDGFAEFFGGLLKNEQGQPWGFTIDAAELGNAPLGPVFEERFDEMLDSLTQRATHRVLNLTSREHREVVLAFPQELNRHKESLQLFADILFEPSRHRERPWIAAIHFISATQEARSIGSIRQTVLSEWNIPAPPLEHPTRGERPYFISGMFTQLVQQAKDAARPSGQALRSMKINRAVSVLALAPFCAGLSWLLADSFLLDSKWLSEVVTATQGMFQYNDLLPKVDKIERPYLVQELDHQSRVEKLLHVQENSGIIGPTHDQASDMLYRRVDDKWILPLEDALDKRLSDGSTWRPGADEKLFADGFLALKADFVIQQKMCTGADPDGTRAWISQYLAGVWREEFKERATDILAGSAPIDMQERLKYFFEHQAKSRIQLDDRLRDDTYRALKGQTSMSQGQISSEVVFNLIVANTNLTSVEKQIDGELLNDPGLKKVFTIDGCEKFLSASNTGKEWWKCLLDIDNPPTIDRDKTYLDKFMDSRNNWLKSIAEAPFKKPINDIGSAAQALSWLEQPQTSELDQLIEVMGGSAIQSKAGRRSRSSNLIPDAPGLLGRLKGCFRRAEYYNATLEKEGILTASPVCREAQQRFTPYALALKEEDKTPIPASYLAYKDSMRRLRDRLTRIHRSANRAPEALTLVLETMNSEGELYELSKNRDEFMTQLRGGTPQVNPDALNSILSLLEVKIWNTLIPEASRALQDAWTTQVFQEWNDIKYRSSRDKENELGACNRIKGFINDKLTPFLDKQLTLFYVGNNLRACQIKEFMGQRMPILPSVCRDIDNSISVSRTLECQDGGGGEAAKPGLPESIEASGQECNFPLEWVELDTGTEIYRCSVSTGRCNVQEGRKSGGRGRLVAKRRGQGNNGLEYYSGYDYGDLLAKGSRRGARVEFPIKQDTCKNMSAFINLVGGSEGKPGKKTDSRYQGLGLPARITIDKQEGK